MDGDGWDVADDLRKENAKLRAELVEANARFTVDINIVKAFDELFSIGKKYSVPEFVLQNWKAKWLDAHLRFHNKKEDELKKDLSEALSTLNASTAFLSYDALHQIREQRPIIARNAEIMRLKDKVIEYSEAMESLDDDCDQAIWEAVSKCWREALRALTSG
jgi:hypothetical protein